VLSATILAVLAMSAPETSLPGPDIRLTEQKQVAYEALVEGANDRATVDLETRLRQDPGDPAALINLGAAYARLGQPDRAADAYRNAANSRTRYQLELADGRWLDSRRAARIALTSLHQLSALAQR
jgi:Tfp pilus assembly protein PilF